MNPFVKSGLVALCLTGLAGCAWKQEVKESGPITFEPVTIPLGDYRLVGGEYVSYNGMTGDNQRFLLSRFIHSATNIYYSTEKREINLASNRLKINFLTPDSIGLTYIETIK